MKCGCEMGDHVHELVDRSNCIVGDLVQALEGVLRFYPAPVNAYEITAIYHARAVIEKAREEGPHVAAPCPNCGGPLSIGGKLKVREE